MLEGFRKYNMSAGTPSVSITENGIAFSKAAIIRLGKPQKVDFLINDSEKKIAIRCAENDTEGAFPFYNPRKKIVSVRWNNKELLSEVENLMQWELKGHIYRANGEYIKNENAMIFDLTKVNVIKSR
jgi:hypothetical protein